MTDQAQNASPMNRGSGKPGICRHLPLIVILTVAAIGAFLLRDTLSFDTLRDNREALLAFRDANYLGLAFETVGRIFKKLEQQGFIETRGRLTQLCNIPELALLAGIEPVYLKSSRIA